MACRLVLTIVFLFGLGGCAEEQEGSTVECGLGTALVNGVCEVVGQDVSAESETDERNDEELFDVVQSNGNGTKPEVDGQVEQEDSAEEADVTEFTGDATKDTQISDTDIEGEPIPDGGAIADAEGLDGGDVAEGDIQVVPTEDGATNDAWPTDVQTDVSNPEDSSSGEDIVSDVFEDSEIDISPLEDVYDGQDDSSDEDTIDAALCSPVGQYDLIIDSAALPGQGCQGGNPGQSALNQIFNVSKDPVTETLTATLVEPTTSGGTEISLTVEETNGADGAPPGIISGCAVRVVLVAGIPAPPMPGEDDPGKVVAAYDYTVHYDATGNVSGFGTVHVEVQYESGEIQAPCTEAISAVGTLSTDGM